MNCEHCLGMHPIECGFGRALCRLRTGLARALRSVLARLARLG